VLRTTDDGQSSLNSFPPIARLLERLLSLLVEEIIIDHEPVHLGTHEASVGIFSCANDRFATQLETGVDHEPASGPFLEGVHERPVSRVTNRKTL